jgi:S-adenosylmethionine synthetase
MGRKPRTVIKKYSSPYFGNIEREVELFTWEKLDHVDEIKQAFGL